ALADPPGRGALPAPHDLTGTDAAGRAVRAHGAASRAGALGAGATSNAAVVAATRGRSHLAVDDLVGPGPPHAEPGNHPALVGATRGRSHVAGPGTCAGSHPALAGGTRDRSHLAVDDLAGPGTPCAGPRRHAALADATHRRPDRGTAAF